MTDELQSTAADDDETLLDELGQAIEHFDAVPESARMAAHGLLTWRSVDDELAELSFDSALDTTAVRGLAWPRQLSFEAAATSIEVEIDRSELIGQVVPPAEVELHLTSASGQVTTTTSDSVGHFRFGGLAPGAVRITALLPDGSITTQWFSI